ncbi:MAG TPA: flavodoxin family protein [Syntrophales bacterium]|nr:flavodoxin family protein [Syntrophales bacterium]
MMVLGISASPRGSRSETLKLVRAALNGAKSGGARVELIDLCKLRIEYCNACGACYKKGRCIKKDDFQAVLAKILAADGLVVGSPNYFKSVTAQMKTMIDRMADAIHCQLLSGTYTVNLATSGGLGQHRQVTDYLNTIMQNFGSFITGSAGVSIRSGRQALKNTETKAFRLGEALVHDIKSKKTYRNQLKTLAENKKYFQNLVKMYKDVWHHEYDYWNRRNWK